MIDFTGVKAITIPEGSVKKITSNGVTLWEKPASFKNLAEPLPNNTTDTTKWVNGYRISSSGITTQYANTPSTVSNIIPCKYGDIIRIKGVSFRPGADRYELCVHNSTNWTQREYVSRLPNNFLDYTLTDEGIHEFTVLQGTQVETNRSIRFAFTTPADASQVIITVNEEIK